MRVSAGTGLASSFHAFYPSSSLLQIPHCCRRRPFKRKRHTDRQTARQQFVPLALRGAAASTHTHACARMRSTRQGQRGRKKRRVIRALRIGGGTVGHLHETHKGTTKHNHLTSYNARFLILIPGALPFGEPPGWLYHVYFLFTIGSGFVRCNNSERAR